MIYLLILNAWMALCADNLPSVDRSEWGFFGHQKINRLAVFTLPIEMIPFYKYHIEYLSEKAVNPDMRRYIDPEEAPRHYIDLDVYGDSAWATMPRYWDEAVAMYTEDTLKAYGTVPWHVVKVKNYLTKAFKNQDSNQILRLSAELGHYIADGNVPLHTTENYNGQMSGQYGIHGFWESRLPELFFEDYDLFTGKATYVSKPQMEIWNGVIAAHMALDSVLRFEKELTERFRSEKKYAYEDRRGQTLKVYSYDFSEAYHRRLDGMVERRMRETIKMIGDFWYTAWVDGGQPDLSMMITTAPIDSIQFDRKKGLDEHESGILVENR
jgi:hypothetical protein